MPAIADIAEDTREMTLEAVIESRLVLLLDEALEQRPDGLKILASHEADEDTLPAIVVSANRTADADIPGWWRVDVEVELGFRDGEMTPAEADAVFRRIDELLGETTPTLLSVLPDETLAVAGVEYDSGITRERSDDTERRTYSLELIAGLKNPNA